MNTKSIFTLLKDTFHAWQEDKAPRLGAALAYYTIFSIGPLLLVVIACVGIVLGKSAAEGTLVGAISNVVGQDGAQFIEGAVKNASKPGASLIATIIGVVTLLLAASGIFGQLQDSLNTVWKAEPKKGNLLHTIKGRFVPFLMIVGCGLLLLATLVAQSTLSVLGKFLSDTLPGGPLLWQAGNFVMSFGVITLLFAMIFRFLPNTHVTWKDVWLGAGITALLFVLGQIVLSFYLGFTNVGSPYGAAGSLVVVLVWIYYSAQLFLFGAEFTRVYAEEQGSHSPEPARRAVAGRKLVLQQSPWFR